MVIAYYRAFIINLIRL